MIKNEKEILNFLTEESQSAPLLLGLSGGPDSTFLFHLLLQAGLPFHAAHINHFWRPESSQEASILATLCHSHQVPFHLHELALQSIKGNLEDACRLARFAFFRAICSEHRLKGVVLGHQADDQAETVLKRVFEGASLAKLKGLTLKAFVEGVPVFRPLLQTPKEEIIEWLNAHQVPYFIDPTNNHPRFLRARMRNELLPILSEHFGKRVSPSLCRLGELAYELHDFLEELLVPYRQQIKETESQIFLNFNQTPLPATAFLWKAVVRDFFEQQKMTLSHSVLKSVIFHLKNSNSLKIMKIGKINVQIQRGVLSIPKGT